MAKKEPRRELKIIKASNNLIEANYKRFTLASKQILWHIARRLQEEGYTPTSFKTYDLLTPQKTIKISLETGKITEDETSKCVKIELDIKRLMRDSKMAYSTILETVERMKKASLQIYSQDKKTRISTTVFPGVEFIDGYQSIVVYMWADILLHLLQLQVWAQLDYNHIMRFKSEYTLRMYELLCKVQNQECATFYKDINGLNEAFDTKYTKITDIKRFCVDVAKKELDQKSSFSFEYQIKYEKKGKGRPAAVGITFFLIKNKPQGTLF